MSIRIYELDRDHVIDTEFGEIMNQYREIMGEYEIPWNDEDWWFRKPEEVQCYKIMGNLYAVVPNEDHTLHIYAKEACNYTYVCECDTMLDVFDVILDEFRR